jgi:hypothetical protein
MKSRYTIFDRGKLHIKPLAEGQNALSRVNWPQFDHPAPAFDHPESATAAERLIEAQKSGAARIPMFGGHSHSFSGDRRATFTALWRAIGERA